MGRQGVGAGGEGDRQEEAGGGIRSVGVLHHGRLTGSRPATPWRRRCWVVVWSW